jgi:hypothetical protein
MRLALALGALLLALPLAGCTGPADNPNLRPPCSPSSPVHLDILADKERYIPGELMNVTLLLNNTGSQARTIEYRTWELSMRSFDGKAIRSYFREQDPDLGGGSKSVAAGRTIVLQERFQPWPVTAELTQPLTPGTYYLCSVLTMKDGNVLSGARPFIAEPPPRQF